MKALSWLPIGRVPELDAQEVAARCREIQLVDVRTPAEFRRSRIPGAVPAPIHRLKGSLDRLGLDRERPVIAICRTAHRSIPAVRLLRSRGYEAAQLAGGMRVWWDKDLPTESG